MSKRDREQREDLLRAFEMPTRNEGRRDPRLPDAREVLRALRAEALGAIATQLF